MVTYQCGEWKGKSYVLEFCELGARDILVKLL